MKHFLPVWIQKALPFYRIYSHYEVQPYRKRRFLNDFTLSYSDNKTNFGNKFKTILFKNNLL